MLFVNELKLLAPKTGILQANLVYTIAADAQVPCVARSSATLVLAVKDNGSFSSTSKNF